MSALWVWVKRIGRWIADRLKDLFYATGNENAELARVVTGLLTGVIVFAVYWNSIHLGKEIDLNALLTGLAAFIAAAGLGILAKDSARKNSQKSDAPEETYELTVEVTKPAEDVPAMPETKK